VPYHAVRDPVSPARQIQSHLTQLSCCNATPEARIFDVIGTPAEKFAETVTPLLHLWESVRVRGIAANSDGQWLNVGIRVQLQEDPLSRSDIISPDQRLLYFQVDYPLASLPDLIQQLVGTDSYILEDSRGTGGAFVPILLRPKRSDEAPQANWYGPTKREPDAKMRESGLLRTSITIGAFGERLHEVVNPDLRAKFDSRLRLAEPGYDGLSGLAKHLFPGVGLDHWEQTLTEVVAELPFEMELTETGKLTVRASIKIAFNSLAAICFYETRAGTRQQRITLRREEAKLLPTPLLQWEHSLTWPGASQRVKVTLFYNEEEIQSVQLTRAAYEVAVAAKAAQDQRQQLKNILASSTPANRPSTAAPTSQWPIFKTALEIYRVRGLVGEGGAGIVYRVEDDDGRVLAIKCLDPDKATIEKRKRFKTELSFCSRNQHRNIITVVDQGLASVKGRETPFYVMPYYSLTLRGLLEAGISHERILPFFSQILDGVEEAHSKNIWHRDLKPENILHDSTGESLLIGDFGIAHFGEEELYTLVETGPRDRLANFQYAAPEQRVRGRTVDHRADIYALGLILNEMFTGEILQGAGYKRISEVAPALAFLDDVVDAMVQQSPDKRPNSISEIKRTLGARGDNLVALQEPDKRCEESTGQPAMLASRGKTASEPPANPRATAPEVIVLRPRLEPFEEARENAIRSKLTSTNLTDRDLLRFLLQRGETDGDAINVASRVSQAEWIGSVERLSKEGLLLVREDLSRALVHRPRLHRVNPAFEAVLQRLLFPRDEGPTGPKFKV
jgi:serine/threonine protein kinase